MMALRTLLGWASALALLAQPAAAQFYTPSSLPANIATVSGTPTSGQCAVFTSSLNITGQSCPGAAAAPGCTNMQTAGAVGNGSTPNDAVLASAYAALPSTGGCLYFPAGKYAFSALDTLTFPASPKTLTIRGDGEINTILTWPSGGGLTFAWANPDNHINASDFTMQIGVAGGSSAFNFQQSSGGGGPSLSHIERVTFRGDTSAHYWDTGISTGGAIGFDVEGISVFGDNIHGIGFNCQGTGPSNASNIITISRSNFWQLGVGLELNSYCQSVYAHNNNYLFGVIGIHSPSAAAGLLTNFIFSGGTISQQSSFGILLSPLILDVQISGMFIDAQANQAAISIGAAQFGNITGMDIDCNSATASFGIVLGATEKNISTTGNTIRGCGEGILLAGGSANNNVQSNNYFGNTTPTVGGGVNGNVIGGGSP